MALGCQTKNGKLWAWLFPGHAKLKRAGAQKEPRAERASSGLDPAKKARRRASKSQRQQDAKASKAAAEQAEREEAALLQSMVAQNLQSAKDAAKAEELQQQELEYDDVKERERALAVASVGTLELLGHLESTLGDLFRRLLERAMGRSVRPSRLCWQREYLAFMASLRKRMTRPTSSTSSFESYAE